MHKNTRLLVMLLAFAIGMLGVAYAFVPLYRIFCQAFGIPVPTVRVGEAGEFKNFGPATTKRTVTVRFTANNAQGMPVILRPTERRMRVQLGQPVFTAYTADNPLPNFVDGVAVHTIIGIGTSGGLDVQEHIELQQCFCFEKQRYPARGDVNLPLAFTVSPDLPAGIHTITFGYTLFEDI